MDSKCHRWVQFQSIDLPILVVSQEILRQPSTIGYNQVNCVLDYHLWIYKFLQESKFLNPIESVSLEDDKKVLKWDTSSRTFDSGVIYDSNESEVVYSLPDVPHESESSWVKKKMIIHST